MEELMVVNRKSFIMTVIHSPRTSDETAGDKARSA